MGLDTFLKDQRNWRGFNCTCGQNLRPGVFMAWNKYEHFSRRAQIGTNQELLRCLWREVITWILN